jgi:CDP-Glycerol:Poly(glycerophosphate) glycerophosphotransferase
MADPQTPAASVRRPLSPRGVVRTLGLAPVLLNLTALVALLGVVWGWPSWIPLVLAALALLAIPLLVRRSFPLTLSAHRPVSANVIARLLVVAMAGLVAAGRGDDLATQLSVFLLGLLLIGEPALAKLAKLGRPYAVRVPGVGTRTKARLGGGVVFVLDTIGVALVLVTAYAPVSGWFVLMWSLGSLVVALLCGLDSLDRLRGRRRFEARLPSLLADQVKPVFALHWDAPATGNAYQVAMWLPYLERLGVPYIIVVRSEANFRQLVALDGGISTAPILLRRNLTDIDPVISPTLKTIFYVNTATKNLHTVRYARLTHIQLNHGDSDKAPSYSPVFRMFDKDFVAGQAAIDRFAAHGIEMPPGIFSIVGRPQVERARPADRPIAEIESKTVLYAPTWSGFHADSNYSSLAVGLEIVEALVGHGCTVIFRPHPFAQRTPHLRAQRQRIIAYLADRASASGKPHAYGAVAETEMDVFDCFNRCDAMVSDVSSVVGDFLFTEKPFAMVAVSTPAARFTEEFPIARAGYVIDAFGGPPRELDQILDTMLGADPMSATRQELKTYYLGDIPAESYVDRFLTEARKYL